MCRQICKPLDPPPIIGLIAPAQRSCLGCLVGGGSGGGEEECWSWLDDTGSEQCVRRERNAWKLDRVSAPRSPGPLRTTLQGLLARTWATWTRDEKSRLNRVVVAGRMRFLPTC